MTTNIDDLTIGQVKQLTRAISGGVDVKPCPFKPGEKYLIRGVTMYGIGRVREVVGDFLVLDDASWVADTGKFSDAMEKGTLNEVERVPDGYIINLGSVCDAQPWTHTLPMETK